MALECCGRACCMISLELEGAEILHDGVRDGTYRTEDHPTNPSLSECGAV